MDAGLFGSAMSGSDDIPREDLDRMLDLYCKTLDRLGYTPEPYADTEAPLGGNLARGSGKTDALAHVAWMCVEARKLLAQGRKEKACRWVGWIQGILWGTGVFSLEELRGHNRYM